MKSKPICYNRSNLPDEILYDGSEMHVNNNKRMLYMVIFNIDILN